MLDLGKVLLRVSLPKKVGEGAGKGKKGNSIVLGLPFMFTIRPTLNGFY